MKRKNHRGLWLRFDRVLAHDIFKQLGILAVLLIIAFGLSYVMLSLSGCEWESFCERKGLTKWLLPLYLLIDPNALNNLYLDDNANSVHGWMLFASSLTFLFGAFIFNGMIIGIITNAIEHRVKEHHEGHIHYLTSGHYIIMGYDDMVSSVIDHIFKHDSKAYILLLTSAEAVDIHEKLKKTFTTKQMEKIIINYGHRTSQEDYKDIRLEFAEQVFIIGNRSRAAHDAINVECVDSICSYLNQPCISQVPNRITCVFEDLDTYAAFKTSEIFEEVRKLGIEFVPYNFFTGWAKQVFVKRYYRDLDKPEDKIPYPAVYGQGIKSGDTKFVHLVFSGTTNFAVAFAMEAAHVLHFPNFNHDHRLKTRITFIDKNADKEKDEFITRYRHFFEVQSYHYQDLSNDFPKEKWETPTYFNRGNGYEELKDYDFLDVEFEFIKGDIFSAKVQKVLRGWALDNEHRYLSIFLALADQRGNFTFAMNMPDEVYDNEIPVFIRQDRSDNFVSNLRRTDEAIKNVAKKNTYVRMKDGKPGSRILGGRYSHIYPFGMNETAYSADEKSLERAKLINYLYVTANYSTNKFTSVMALDSISEERVWQEANEAWKTLSVALKWSNLYNAYTIRTKVATLRAMRGLRLDDGSRDLWPLSDEEVEELARVEHNRWNVEKLLMGYRKPHRDEDKYEFPEFAGDLKKNKERFIHHDIRPFDELGSIRELDYEFSRYIPWILKMTEDE